MHHVSAGLGHQRDLVVGELGHVHGQQAWRQQAEVVQAGERALAGVAHGHLDLAGGFMHMHHYGHIQLFGQGDHFL